MSELQVLLKYVALHEAHYIFYHISTLCVLLKGGIEVSCGTWGLGGGGSCLAPSSKETQERPLFHTQDITFI